MSKRLGCIPCWPDSRKNGKRGIGTRVLPLLADAVDGTGDKFRQFNEHFMQAKACLMIDFMERFNHRIRADVVGPYAEMIDLLYSKFHNIEIVKREIKHLPEARQLWRQMDEVEKEYCLEIIKANG